MLAHGGWFSPGTPASSTTKSGCQDIAEILLKVALNIKNQSIFFFFFKEPPYRPQNSSQDYDEYDNDRNDFSRRQEALSRSDGFSNSRQDGFSKNRSLEFPSNRSMQPKPPSKLNQRVISPHFHPPTNNPSDNFPPAKPRPAPRQPNMKQAPRPPPRRTPSPTREAIHSPPLSSQSTDMPLQKPSPPPPIDPNRPDSASKPPGSVS